MVIATKHICIIGGGISGLSAALFLRNSPNIGKITLLEASSRLGGWLNSENIGINGHEVLLEQGTRTLSFKSSNKRGFLSLYQELKNARNLKDKILCLDRGSAVNKNKFVVYQGRVVQLPSGLLSALANPLTRQLPWSVIKDVAFSSKTDYNGDVSVHDMFSRFDEKVANYLVGSFIHGVYGGDISKWSGEATFGWLLKHLRTRNSFTLAALNAIKESVSKNRDLDLPSCELDTILKKAALITFEGGMRTLVDAVVEELQRSDKISIRLNAPCISIESNGDDLLNIELDSRKILRANKVISCAPSSELSRLTNIKPERHVLYQTLTPVHIILRKKHREARITVDGKESFGILNPIIESTDFTGIIFESSAFPTKQPNPDINVITVMLKNYSGITSVQDFALEILNRHVDPYTEHFDILDVVPHENRNAIPQFGLGHCQNINNWQIELSKRYNGNLHVLGAFSSGIGVPDCIQSAYNLSLKLENVQEIRKKNSVKEEEQTTKLVIRRNHDKSKQTVEGLHSSSNRPTAPVDFRSFILTNELNEDQDAESELKESSSAKQSLVEQKGNQIMSGTIVMEADELEDEDDNLATIPNQDLIDLAKKRRQMAREHLNSRRPNADRFGISQKSSISLDVDMDDDDGNVTFSEQINEEEDDIYGAFEDYKADKLAFGSAAVQTLHQKNRIGIQEALEDRFIANNRVYDVEDEEMIEWERSQIHKGASAVKDLDATFLDQQMIQDIPEPINIPSFETLLSDLQQNVKLVKIQSNAQSQEFSRLSELVEKLNLKQQANVEHLASIGTNYYFFQEFLAQMQTGTSLSRTSQQMDELLYQQQQLEILAQQTHSMPTGSG